MKVLAKAEDRVCNLGSGVIGIVGHLIWVFETELRSYARTAGSLRYQAVSSAPSTSIF